ncbi:MAG: LrgB family protein [Paludibacterium sp.]|uniref:LrgB family protein n=1 Tax=Paludibacterium sp. TaxID=1917523 RepID=UPI0025F3C3E5|nr:LrgB family protein [Paludibacterium sp.]MBV8046213.1 LrgB family protein [Paludibacterium sp.]MBV8646923.1 LrgB family protein [Paludibacterium sp.]
MSDLFWAVLSLLMTVLFYIVAKTMYRRTKSFWFTPLLAAPIAVLALVMLLRIPLPDYFMYTHWLVALLGPATIAFALPIYRQRHMIMRYPLTLAAGVGTGLILGLLSNWGLARLLGLPPVLARSLLPRSVSTPFAILASSNFGGLPDITALMVVFTGVIGMLCCEPIYKLIRIRSAHGRGAGLGSSSHGAGTAKAHEIGQEEGVVSSLTMVFVGILMVLLSPLFAQILS